MNILSYSSVGQKANTGLTALKPRDWQGCALFWKLQGECVSLPFLAPEVYLHPVAHDALSPYSKWVNITSLCPFFHYYQFSLFLTEPEVLYFKDSCDYIELARISWIISLSEGSYS